MEERLLSANYLVHDDQFLTLCLPNAKLEKLCTGMLWTEGPVYFPQGDFLLFSDIPNNKMYQWIDGLGRRVYREHSNYSNGNTRDFQGRLITCEHLSRRVTRTELDGSISILVDQYQGKPLNSPNDVVVKRDGSIWFTDPPYGILTSYEGKKSDQQQEGCFVYRLDPNTKDISVVARDFDKPNGLAFSPDEKTLYVSDTGLSHRADGPHHIRHFAVQDHTALSGGDVFANIKTGVPDGFRIDTAGNLWTSCATGVQCFNPQGTLLGEILVPETVANIEFGGPKRNRLYITASTSLYAIYVATQGLR
ncbi:MAG: SMP-30/gluconolactonase/LRE family protein [Oceanospirillaceae bacterium]|nr:SMP-30/gluconolactonase/LRE family protein [Oceanospirillaceae bacterium]